MSDYENVSDNVQHLECKLFFLKREVTNLYNALTICTFLFSKPKLCQPPPKNSQNFIEPEGSLLFSQELGHLSQF
jgi:hypothetical protein